MTFLTPQERKAVAFISLAVLLGILGTYLSSKYPMLNDTVHFIDSDYFFTKIDVNRATYEELVAIPFIGPYTATQILEYRVLHQRISSILELKDLPGIHRDNYEKFSRYLKVEVEK